MGRSEGDSNPRAAGATTKAQTLAASPQRCRSPSDPRSQKRPTRKRRGRTTGENPPRSATNNLRPIDSERCASYHRLSNHDGAERGRFEPPSRRRNHEGTDASGIAAAMPITKRPTKPEASDSKAPRTYHR